MRYGKPKPKQTRNDEKLGLLVQACKLLTQEEQTRGHQVKGGRTTASGQSQSGKPHLQTKNQNRARQS